MEAKPALEAWQSYIAWQNERNGAWTFRRKGSLGRLAVAFEWKSRKCALGRFGGGWNWELGFMAGGNTVMLNMLVCSLRATWKKKGK